MSLSTRIEHAGGPSRGLDAEIELAIGNWSIHHFDAWNHFQECGEAVNPPMCQPVDPSRYTTSLDAAMTLVPDSHLVSLDIRPSGAAVVLFPKDRKLHEPSQCRFAATPALALCAAALKSRGL